jgi:hypothetical protein
MLNGTIALRVPLDVIRAKCASYRCHGKPWHRSGLQNLDDYDIVRIFPLLHAGRWSSRGSLDEPSAWGRGVHDDVLLPVDARVV